MISAPKSIAWEIVSDADGYSKYAPNIDYSRVTSGKGKNMIRECSNEDGKWSEVCSQWIDGESYMFEVQTNEKNYPYPFKF